jgi:hypothetical protein
MASYWIVVPRGNAELFDLLSMAFRGRTDFSVIVDRRTAVAAPPGVDRRPRGEALGPDEIVIAEQAERPAVASDERTASVRAVARRPVVRRLPRTDRGGRHHPTAAPIAARTPQRLFTL